MLAVSKGVADEGRRELCAKADRAARSKTEERDAGDRRDRRQGMNTEPRVELLTADFASLKTFLERVLETRFGVVPPDEVDYPTLLLIGKQRWLVSGDGENGPLCRLNRRFSTARKNAYLNAMLGQDGESWWFTPDPIVVTTEGYIVNGQHRLVAAIECCHIRLRDDEASGVRWSIPTFVVVWGVERQAALLMDEARRNATDRRDIAVRYATVATGEVEQDELERAQKELRTEALLVKELKDSVTAIAPEALDGAAP